MTVPAHRTITLRTRRLAVLIVLTLASLASVGTTPAYALLPAEHSETITLSPEAPAALLSFTVTLTAAALPDREGLLANRTYGRVFVAFDDDLTGVEVALATSADLVLPEFQAAAGEHAVFDAATCDLLRDCRRTVHAIVRLADGVPATEVDVDVRSGVYYPDAALPAGAALTYSGLDAPAVPVAVHALEAELAGDAVLDPARPIEIHLRYDPPRTTILRIHGGSLAGTYVPPPAPSASASTSASASVPALPRLGVELRRGEQIAFSQGLAPGESISQDVEPLAGCLATCDVAYRIVLAPSEPLAGRPAVLAWRASAWVFVVAEPGGTAPSLTIQGGQVPYEG